MILQRAGKDERRIWRVYHQFNHLLRVIGYYVSREPLLQVSVAELIQPIRRITAPMCRKSCRPGAGANDDKWFIAHGIIIMATFRSDMKNIVIFSENDGWHEQRLASAFKRYGIHTQVVSLKDCHIGFEQRLTGLHIPGFVDTLPDAVFVRAVAAGSFEEVTFRLDILHALKYAGVVVYNDAASIERTVDKGMTSFLLIQNRVPAPPVWVCETAEAAHNVIHTQLQKGRRIVQKPLFGNCGRGLQLIDSMDYQLDAELINGVYYLQQFIDQDDHSGRDWRVFVINHRAVAAMERISGHWVTNRARGGKCLPAVLTPALRELAEAASKATGILYGGVDIIRDAEGKYLVLEVNSVPAWRGLQSVCPADITDLLVKDILYRRSDILAKHVHPLARGQAPQKQ